MTKSVAVIGCGYWGKNIVRNFAEIGELAAICEGNPVTAATVSTTYNVPVLTFDEILNRNDIRGVAIAAPAATHYELARKTLLAGKDVFVEKPLSLDVKEGEDLCALATQKKAVLMVGHLLQYHVAYLKLKSMIENGDIGTLRYIYSNRLNLGKVRTEEDVLWSFAPHDISMILGLVGDAPVDVTAQSFSTLTPSIADTVTVHMNFKQNIAAHVHVSWINPFKEQKLVVIGDKAMAVFDDGLPLTQKLIIYPHSVDVSGAVPQVNKADGIAAQLDTSEPLRNECQHFVDCIHSRATPRTDGYEGLRVLDILNRASQKMASAQKVAA
jgi:UDP-2-acetamido-3-amino-2,3-dideoxy-glucuronate N-acetyltransferase